MEEKKKITLVLFLVNQQSIKKSLIYHLQSLQLTFLCDCKRLCASCKLPPNKRFQEQIYYPFLIIYSFLLLPWFLLLQEMAGICIEEVKVKITETKSTTSQMKENEEIVNNKMYFRF